MWAGYVTTYEVVDGKFIPWIPVKWEENTFYQRGNVHVYCVHPNGQGLMVRELAEGEDEEQAAQGGNKVVLFQNFAEHLRKTAPSDRK